MYYIFYENVNRNITELARLGLTAETEQNLSFCNHLNLGCNVQQFSKML